MRPFGQANYMILFSLESHIILFATVMYVMLVESRMSNNQMLSFIFMVVVEKRHFSENEVQDTATQNGRIMTQDGERDGCIIRNLQSSASRY